MAKRVQTSSPTKRSQAKKQVVGKATSKESKKAKSAKTARAGTLTAKGNATRKTTAAKRKAAKTVRATDVKSKASKATTGKKAVPKQAAKKKSVAKKGAGKATRAVSESPSDVAPPEPPPPKTYLNEKELAQFRELLLLKRAELAGDVHRLATEALNSKGSAYGEQSAMPIHMADLGTDNWEQEFTLGLLENEKALVREIDEALARIHDLTYGMCLATRKRISKARLRAKPWAKYCIEYARAREEGRLT